MTDPQVSVIIPTYNRADLLVPCLESLDKQTFRDFEAVVVDDGSTDATAMALARFPFVRYFHQAHQGIPAALNRAISEARGEQISFLDSDDLLLENCLEAQAKALARHPNVGLVHAQAWDMDRHGRVVALRKPAFAEGSYVRSGLDEIRDLVFACHITTSTVAVRKRCFAEVGPFDPEFSPLGEDWDMWVRIARRFDVAYIDKPLGVYRVHAGPSGNIYGHTDIRTLERIRRLQMDRIFLDGETGYLFAGLKDKAYFRHHWLVATKAYKATEMPLARRHLVKCARVRPRALPGPQGLSLTWLLFKTFVPVPIAGRWRASIAGVRSIQERRTRGGGQKGRAWSNLGQEGPPE